jgi:glycosyltransferase involved in cell wall biosynthesis
MKFSIVMPTYRRPHTLWRAVCSVVGQGHQDWELILVNNDTGPLAELPSDPRIKVHHHAERPSASYARNQGLRYVTGDAVCYLDDDDMMTPQALMIFDHHLRNDPKAKLVRAGCVLADGVVTYDLSTQVCAIRREYATATWDDKDAIQDQRYWWSIIHGHRWTEEAGDIVASKLVVAVLFTDQRGGLRAGCL